MFCNVLTVERTRALTGQRCSNDRCAEKNWCDHCVDKHCALMHCEISDRSG